MQETGFYCKQLGSQSCKAILCAACQLIKEQRPRVKETCSRRSSSECCSSLRHVELLWTASTDGGAVGCQHR